MLSHRVAGFGKSRLRYEFLRNPLADGQRVPVREAWLTVGVYF